MTTTTSNSIRAYRVYVDGSGSMAPFLAPDDAGAFVTSYEELLFRLFTAIQQEDSAETWLFGDSLVHLPNAPEAKQRLLTRSTYSQGHSRLEFAFGGAGAYLDSISADSTAKPDSAPPSTQNIRTGVAIIITDALQYGSGRQLHRLAEFERLIRRHVTSGGSFAFVAGTVNQYPARSNGRIVPSGRQPVFAFLFADGEARNDLERLARELANGLRSASAQGGDGRYFLLPPVRATSVRLRPRAGVQQVISTLTDPPLVELQTGGQDVEILARLELDPLTRANLPAELSASISRCAGGAWDPAGGDSAGWSPGSVRVDSAANGVEVTLRRSRASSARSGLYRVRIEGDPVPPWIGSQYGAGRSGAENDIDRFFLGIRQLVGTDVASFGTFYIRIRSD